MPLNAKQTFLKDSRKTLMEIAGTLNYVTVKTLKYPVFSKSLHSKHAKLTPV